MLRSRLRLVSHHVFRYFENLVNPYPQDLGGTPPRGLFAFILHFTRPVLPLLTLLQALVTHQSIFGNYPMIGRWLAHRHMLGQSLAFYQDEFAGRVSQKVMQTALAIRETVTKLMDLMVYVVVYFVGAMVLLGSAEPWLMLPLVAWLAGYIAIQNPQGTHTDQGVRGNAV